LPEQDEFNPIPAKDFIEKSKKIFGEMLKVYENCHEIIEIKDHFMNDDICSKCKGFGQFDENGIMKDCQQDKENGICYQSEPQPDVDEFFEELTNIMFGEKSDFVELAYNDVDLNCA